MGQKVIRTNHGLGVSLMAEAEIGVIGLGVMGANLALNIANNGYRVAVYNRTASRTEEFAAFPPASCRGQDHAPAPRFEDFVATIRPPRPVIIMIQAGDPGRPADRGAQAAACG